MKKIHVDIAIFTEAKIHDNIYPRLYVQYNIITTTALFPNQGGLTLAWRDNPGYCIKSVTLHD
jgi:hypothetical protein